MMTRLRYIWTALACCMLFATASMGCTPIEEDGGGETDPVPSGNLNLQCLRWESACGDDCVDRLTDVEHCGACGRTCDSGQLCAQGACVDSCPDGLERCGDACVDFNDSEEHCGACDNRCYIEGAAGICQVGECSDWQCAPERLDEDGDRSNGCERVCEGRDFDSGTHDFDIEVLDVRGNITIDGQPPEGREVGAVVFESLDTDGHVFVPVFPQEDYNYRLNLYPGLYTVRLVDDTICNPRYSSCPGPQLEEVVEITGDTELDMDLPEEEPFPGETVQIDGEIQVNGQQLDSLNIESNRARVSFSDGAQLHQFFVRGEGPATFEGEVPVGTYRVTVLGLRCDSHALPCQQKVVGDEVTITDDTTFDWDFDTVEFSGEVTTNGRQLTDSTAGNQRGTVMLRSTDPDHVGDASVPLSPSGPGTFSTNLHAGTYDLWLQNTSDCPGDGSEAIPCKNHRVDTDVELSADTERDLDVETVTLSGEVTMNGHDMLDSPATRNRGRLEFTDEESTQRVMFGQAGAVAYAVKMYPGTYAVTASNRSGCDLSRPVIPCQTKDLGTLEVDESRTWDVDLGVYTLSGELTLDGQPFPDTEQRNRGTVTVLVPGSDSGPSSQLGSVGPAEFNARIFAGSGYRLVVSYECSSDENILPCGSATVRDDISVRDDRHITRDLRPIRLSGSISANGVELDSLKPTANLVLQRAGSETLLRLDNDSTGRFSALAFPGEYRVLYRSNSYHCDETMPCGTTVARDRFDVSSGASLDVDLDVIELDGEMSYPGLGSSRRPQGDLIFRHGSQELRVSVGAGNYGPVRLLDQAYRLEFHTRSCRQASDIPCMPYLLAGCE